MPLVDLPLESLLTYEGRNACPVDFDAYWDLALAELDATEDIWTMEPHPALGIANCLSLWFQGVDGAKLHAKYCGAQGPGEVGNIVLFFHGYGGRSPEWWSLLSWVAAGYGVLALDCRGQAGQSEDPGGHKGSTWKGHIVRGLEGEPTGLYYRNVFLDTAQIARIAHSWLAPGGKLFATGASQGGGLALACAALSPFIARTAAVYPFLCDYRRVWELDLARDAYQEIRDWFRNCDPNHLQEAEVFARLGYIDVQHLAPRITASTLLVTSLMDTITPPSTQFAVFNKLRRERKYLLYPDFGHEGLPDVYQNICGFFDGELKHV